MINRFLSAFILLALFISINAKVLQLPVFELADEFLLGLSLLVITYYIVTDLLNSVISKIYLIIILYVVYQYVNYLYSPFELFWLMVLAQSFINLKVFLVSLATILIFSKGNGRNRAIDILFVVTIVLFIVGFGLNIALGEEWHRMLDRKIDYRYGYLRPIGYFGHPGQNAYYFSLTFVTLILLYGKKIVLNLSSIVSKFITLAFIQILITFPFTVRKGIMMMIPFGYFLYSMLSTKSRILLLSFIVFIAYGLWSMLEDSLIVVDTLQNISYFTEGDHHYIRGLMIYHGFSLFAENFPFGVGGATFGTALSKYNTLDVYTYVGLPRYYYDSSDKLTGVYDSGIASMLAEGGFIGMVFITLFLFYFFKFNRNHLDWYNYQIFKIITGFTIILSITEPVWQNGLYTSFYVVNLLFIYNKNNTYRELGTWVK